MRQITMFFRAKVLIFALMMGLLGCAPSGSGQSSEQVASLFYEAIRSKDFALAASYFTTTHSVEGRIEELQVLYNQLGDLQSYELKSKLVNTVFSGVRYTLKYRLKYANKTVTDMIILFEHVSGEPMKIEVRNLKYRHTS